MEIENDSIGKNCAESTGMITFVVDIKTKNLNYDAMTAEDNFLEDKKIKAEKDKLHKEKVSNAKNSKTKTTTTTTATAEKGTA